MSTTTASSRPLRRAREGRVVAGVARGIAETYGVDVALVRVLFVLTALGPGPGFVAYVLLWLLVAEEGTERSATENVIAGAMGGLRR